MPPTTDPTSVWPVAADTQRTPDVPESSKLAPPRIPAWTLHTQAACRARTVELQVLDLGGDYGAWRAGVVRDLEALGLACYVHDDYPNTEAHRENNQRVKLALVQALRRVPGVGAYVPAERPGRRGPKHLFDLVSRVVLAPRKQQRQQQRQQNAGDPEEDVRGMLLEFVAGADRARFGSFEEMALRLLYLRAMLERAGVAFADRAAARAVLQNLGRDAAHAGWARRMLDENRRNPSSRDGSAAWDALMTKLCWLSADEKPGPAAGAASAAMVPDSKMEE